MSPKTQILVWLYSYLKYNLVMCKYSLYIGNTTYSAFTTTYYPNMYILDTE